MIQARRSGFTLVELLMVVVIAAIIMGAVVQSLIVQERTYRTTGEQVRGQDALRIAIGILESELREVAASAVATGGSDILLATPDSIRFRAHRKLGIVCARSANDRFVFTWAVTPQDRFVPGSESPDTLFLIFQDNLPQTGTDDRWIAVRADQVQNNTGETCASRPLWGGDSDTRLRLVWPDGSTIPSAEIQGILPGAPIRSFERITYGLHPHDGGWALRRRVGNDVQTLVTGLAGEGEGLVFSYFDGNGNPIIGDPIADPTQVAAIRVTATTAPHPGTGASPGTLETQIFLRNN